MIPSEEKAKALWDKYELPEPKRRHVTLVAKVAEFLADRIGVPVNKPLLQAAALLHDIDKNATKLPGEKHPDAAVRILREEGMGEVADLVSKHSLHSIFDPALVPKTWEEKLLYLADKMVKYEVITVDERFKLWRDEHLPREAQKVLDRAYPKAKELEAEILTLAQLKPEEICNFFKAPV